MTRVKICGVTTEEDARAAVEAGADLVGINLVAGGKRVVDLATAARLVEAVNAANDAVITVAVVASGGHPDDVDDLRYVLQTTGVDRLQLHGDEPPSAVAALQPRAFKAVRIGGPADVDAARGYPGEWILVDAKVAGALGGTGHRFDWTLLGDLVAQRPMLLAGGLRPDNVAEAVRRVRPWAVDVASGVEGPGGPRRKEAAAMRAFVAAVRAADEDGAGEG